MKDFFLRYKIEILIFLIIFIVKGVFNFLLPGLTMTTGADEIGTIAGAAFTAGYPWSGVISVVPYYGLGYSFLMAPLFALGLSPSAVHIGMLFYNTACIAICGIICYRILIKIFRFDNTRIAVLLSVTTVFFAPNLLETNLVMNESMLILLNWIVLYFLLIMHKRIEDGKKNTLYSLILAFVLCYGFLVHTRIIFIWGAAAVFIILHLIINRKLLINLPVFAASFAVFFVLFKLVISNMQSVLWGGSGGAIPNSVESLSLNLSQLLGILNGRALIVAFKTFIGQLYSVFCFTGGFAYILFAALIAGIVCLIIPRFRARAFAFIRGNKSLVLAVSFIVIQLVAIFIFVSLYSIDKTSVEFGYVNTKYFLYARYWAACAAPATMLAIVLICRLRNGRKLIGFAGVLTLIFIALFLYKIAPLLYGVKNNTSSIFYQYSGLAVMQNGDAFSSISFLTITLIAGVATVLIFIFLIKRKYAAALVVMLVFSFCNYVYPTMEFDVGSSQKMSTQYSEVVTLFDHNGITPDKYPDIYFNIYDITAMPVMNVQFNLYRFRIMPFTDISIDVDNIPIIVTAHRNSLGAGTFEALVLDPDDKTYLAVLVNKNEHELIQRLENAGYSFVEIDAAYTKGLP